ncbi:hypothetical protein EJ08DRAFT_174598 [Tothia fuscella]|uniref:Mitotic checkpoint regulator, MAD2B-interacting-domain-containing protein n=1 Tax=Tothia fuscella TaxID=1048955 RepID=A0A9P4TYT0_9PEZI|nr:hypothetical protein EJ08DRAFT_174598 [Tothia fuscella]
MNLVAYSDSEDSGDEAPQPQPQPSKAPPKAFAKLVNPSTHKVKVNLATPAVKDDLEKEAPPAKKPRTGGGGLNISAFLPAPKKTAPPKGLGKGVNLRTGAEPAFSREVATPTYSEEDDGKKEENEKGVGGHAEEPTPAKPAHSDVKLVGNSMRFKPLSVSRNAKKKKKVLPPPTMIASSTSDSIGGASSQQATPAKPKRSLFSMNKEETSTITTTSSTGDYNPMMLEQEEVPEAEVDDFDDTFDNTPFTAPPPKTSTTATHSVQTLTSDLNLSEADMRQLFGRKGKNQAIPENIQIQSFNTDAEYTANNELIAKGETITHNPVRGIAPGKHSLKQLVNAAQTNKEALEEHFAMGQRNKREAGARYGW